MRPSGSACDERVTDAAEQSVARFGVRVEDLVEVRQPQVGVADDARDQPPLRSAVAGDELGLADRCELVGPVGAISGAALHEHRPLDPVPAADVGEQLGEAVRQRSAAGHR